jgi:hypothetical protein
MLYKQLRTNYEKTGRYHEAGEFFEREMEMRRKQMIGKRDSLFTRVLLWLYKGISGYGEKPGRALAFFIIYLVYFALVYFLMGIPTELTNSTEYFTLINLGYAVVISLSVTTLGRFPLHDDLMQIQNIGFCTVRAVQLLIGIIFISMLIISINRKFRRIYD